MRSSGAERRDRRRREGREAGLLAGMDVRTAAWRVLLDMEQGAPAQAALDAFLRASSLTAGGKGQCTELVYGCLRTELRLAFVLGRLLPHPEKLPRSCLLLLELAAYAMIFMESMPAYAVVDWAVGQARQCWGQRLAGVVNGVLRSLGRMLAEVRQREFYVEPCPSGGRKAAARAARMELSRWYAMPRWIVDVWCSSYGMEAAEALLARSFRRPWNCLRLNPEHAQADAVRAALLALAAEEDCIPLTGGSGFAFAPGKSPALLAGREVGDWVRQGAVSWQAAGSQAVLEALGCQSWRVPVWDACCGQGGKTAFLLERGVPVVLASDMHPGRLGRVRSECRRLGLSAPLVVLADMTQPPVRQWAGNVLLDVPCTGLGTLARRPDIRRHRAFAVLEEMRALQERILDAAWQVMAPGYELAYITCALDPQENEGQVAAFLARHQDAELLREWQTPHDHPWMEGMYGACLRKREG